MVLATLADAERPDGPAILPRLFAGLIAAAGRRDHLGVNGSSSPSSTLLRRLGRRTSIRSVCGPAGRLCRD